MIRNKIILQFTFNYFNKNKLFEILEGYKNFLANTVQKQWEQFKLHLFCFSTKLCYYLAFPFNLILTLHWLSRTRDRIVARRNRQLQYFENSLVQAGFWGWVVTKISIPVSGTVGLSKYLVATAFTKPITFVFGSLNILGLGFLGKYFYTSGGDISILWDNMPARAASGVYQGFSRVGSFFSKVYNFFQDPWSFIWGKSKDVATTVPEVQEKQQTRDSFMEGLGEVPFNFLLKERTLKTYTDFNAQFEIFTKRFIERNNIHLLKIVDGEQTTLKEWEIKRNFYRLASRHYIKEIEPSVKEHFFQHPETIINRQVVRWQQLLKNFQDSEALFKKTFEFELPLTSRLKTLSICNVEQELHTTIQSIFPEGRDNLESPRFLNLKLVKVKETQGSNLGKQALFQAEINLSSDSYYFHLEKYIDKLKKTTRLLQSDAINLNDKFDVYNTIEKRKWISVNHRELTGNLKY